MKTLSHTIDEKLRLKRRAKESIFSRFLTSCLYQGTHMYICGMCVCIFFCAFSHFKVTKMCVCLRRMYIKRLQKKKNIGPE